MKHYTQENKPNFKMDERVTVDMSVIDMRSYGLLPGRIVGRGPRNIYDLWLVEFNVDFSPSYPYKVLPILHIAFLDFDKPTPPQPASIK